MLLQDGVRIIWRPAHVSDWIIPPYDKYRARRSGFSLDAKVEYVLTCSSTEVS